MRRLDGDERTVFTFSENGVPLPDQDGRRVFEHDLTAAPDGSLWLAFDARDGTGGLARFDGTSWERLDPLGKRYQTFAVAVAVGDGGVVWAALTGCRGQGCLEKTRNHRYFHARYDGETWTVLGQEDGAAQTNNPGAWATKMAVSPSGHLLTTTLDQDGRDRLVLFDADGPRAWPEPLGSGDIEAAPDGSFWVLSGGLHIYGPAVSGTR